MNVASPTGSPGKAEETTTLKIVTVNKEMRE